MDTDSAKMRWLGEAERTTVAGLGGLAVLGLGILIWQSHHAPITVEPGPPPPYAQWEAAIHHARQVDLNAAPVEELERLRGIGPTLAQRIVDYRQAHGPFGAPEELQQVPGVGPKTYDAVKDDIAVR